MPGVDERRRWPGAGQRRRSFLSVPLAGGEAQGGREAEEEEGTVAGVKRASLPPPHIYTKGAGSWGSWVVLHPPDRSCRESPRGDTEWGGGYCNRAMTQ
jgi:hypothetical protein